VLPVLAQQLIDASGDGDLAFIAFAAMCFIFVAILFAIDVVRKRRSGDE
jgi:hypothetical protein